MKTIKRLLLGLTLGMLLVSCSPEEEVKDCECDRVIVITQPQASFNIPGGGFSTPAKFITINDCTGLQLEKTGYNVKVGDCR
jgi:hypothetical protein